MKCNIMSSPMLCCVRDWKKKSARPSCYTSNTINICLDKLVGYGDFFYFFFPKHTCKDKFVLSQNRLKRFVEQRLIYVWLLYTFLSGRLKTVATCKRIHVVWPNQKKKKKIVYYMDARCHTYSERARILRKCDHIKIF